MAGLTTNGVDVWDGEISLAAGLIAVDTNLPAGADPQTVGIPPSALGLGGAVALTDAASIATNLALGSLFSVTLGGNRTLANPTNPTNGGTYRWKITQDGTGSRTLAYGNKFLFPGGAPTATTTAGGIDIITAVYDLNTDKYYAVMTKAYAT